MKKFYASSLSFLVLLAASFAFISYWQPKTTPEAYMQVFEYGMNQYLEDYPDTEVVIVKSMYWNITISQPDMDELLELIQQWCENNDLEFIHSYLSDAPAVNEVSVILNETDFDGSRLHATFALYSYDFQVSGQVVTQYSHLHWVNDEDLCSFHLVTDYYI